MIHLIMEKIHSLISVHNVCYYDKRIRECILINVADVLSRQHFQEKIYWQDILFVCFDSLHPSQQFFSYVGTGFPGLNQD